MNYRREIDGLRAFAVLPVILYHAGFKAFSGGFVGVDVFFVISGYLITGILLSELECGQFSILKFYERRARRILPALFFVMLVSLLFAWFLLLPRDMKSFSESLAAVSVFASNILFWRTAGYFNTSSEFMPMLHTWSLAVEEQYYLFFPVFLAFVWRLGRRNVVALLAVAFVVSLAASQWASTAKPEADFYLLPTRGWELLVGVFVAFFFSRYRGGLPLAKVNEIGGFIGVLLIAYAVFAFDIKTPFPSCYALVPTIGTGLVILCSSQATLIGRVLGNSVLVGVGLISYSAYLWHQPIFAFVRYAGYERPGSLEMLLLCGASLGLAYLSWKYVETPFRDRSRFTRNAIFRFAALGSAGFLIVGMTGYAANGFAWRIPADQAAFLDYFENSTPQWRYFARAGILSEFRSSCDFYDLTEYRNGSPSGIPINHIADECHVRSAAYKHAVLLWGDSHAEQLYPGLKRAIPSDWQVLQVTSSGCVATLDAKRNRRDYCEYSNWFAYQTIERAKPEVVVIGQNEGHNLTSMNKMSRRLLAIGVKRVIFTGPSPHWAKDLPNVAVSLWGHVPARTQVGLDHEVVELDRELRAQFNQTEAVRYVSIIKDLCDGGGCVLYFGNDIKRGISSWDYGHLTPIASTYFAKATLAKEIAQGF